MAAALPNSQSSWSRSSGSAANPDVKFILNLTREFVEGFNAGDLDRMMKFYADEYVDVNMHSPHQTKAERREYYRRIVADGREKVEVIPEEIVVAGDHAYAWGTIYVRGVTRRPSKSGQIELRYMEVLRRYPDGWKSMWGMDADLYAE